MPAARKGDGPAPEGRAEHQHCSDIHHRPKHQEGSRAPGVKLLTKASATKLRLSSRSRAPRQRHKHQRGPPALAEIQQRFACGTTVWSVAAISAPMIQVSPHLE